MERIHTNLVNPYIPMSDQDIISLYNIKQTVKRIKRKLEIWESSVDPVLSSPN